MKQPINEIKRMQLLAGLITESEYRKSLNEAEAPSDIKNFLLGMMDSFSEGNDNEYPAGKHMEFKYEEEYGDEDLYGEKTAKLFNKAKSFLSKSGPVTIQDTFAGQPLDLTFSVDGGDIKMEWIEPAINESQLNEETFYDKMKKANPGWSKEQTLSDFADEYEKQDDWDDIDVSGDYEDHQEYLKDAEMWFDKMASTSPTVSIGDIVKVFAKSINKEVLGKIVGETMMQGNYGYAGNVEPNKIPAWKIDCYTEKNIGTSKKPIEYEGKKYYYIGTVQYPQYEEGTSFSKV